jgi:hypothetical protein
VLQVLGRGLDELICAALFSSPVSNSTLGHVIPGSLYPSTFEENRYQSGSAMIPCVLRFSIGFERSLRGKLECVEWTRYYWSLEYPGDFRLCSVWLRT